MNIDEPPSDEFPDPEKDEGADEEENEVMEGVGSEDESEDNEEDNEDNDNEENEEEDADAEEDDQDNGHFSSSSETLKSPGTQASTSPPAHRKRKRSPPLLQPNADRCTSYDIVPVLAAPHATSVNTITATRDMRWVFTGGSDGYIRKFDHFGGMNGRVPLTVAQKHPFVDSVTKAGVLLSYWENEEPPDDVFSTPVKHSMNAPKISSVYCLAVHSEGLWMLSGLESGGINLQTVRHDEGTVIHCFKKHTSAVSVLQLANDEQSVLSGGWDRQVHEWDLNTGGIVRSYANHTGQISSILFRPSSELPIYPSYQPPSPPKVTTATYDHTRRGSLGSDASLDSLFGEDASPNGNINEGLHAPVIENDQPDASFSLSSDFTLSGDQQQPCRDVFMTSSIDGTISLWDRRMDKMVARLAPGPKGTPPWCMSACWSTNGEFIYAGRRNSTVDEYSLHKPTSPPSRTFRFPSNSNAVTAVSAMPNGRHLICASFDNLRLYDLTSDQRHGIPPFWIIPGHQSGYIASIFVDPTCRFLLTAGGNRGWGGSTTDVVLGYEINVVP